MTASLNVTCLWVNMGATNELERVSIRINGLSSGLVCTVTKEENGLITLRLPEDGIDRKLEEGTKVALIRNRYRQTIARTGSINSVDGDMIEIKLEAGSRGVARQDDSKLTECQLPAMFRPKSDSGFYGCWRGAFIVKHGPDRLYLQIEEDQTIPRQAELMFSPIGAEVGASSGRMYGDEGSVINASDVRSRRIRVRALTKDVLPSDMPGTVTLVMDITRTLYRTA